MVLDNMRHRVILFPYTFVFSVLSVALWLIFLIYRLYIP